MRRLRLQVLLPRLVRALVVRSGLSLVPIGAVPSQERCVGRSLGQGSDKRRWVWSKMASSEGERGGDGEVKKRDGEGERKWREKRGKIKENIYFRFLDFQNPNLYLS